MSESIHVRGEGGAVWEMGLPLRPDHAKRLASGALVRVNPDGSGYTGLEPVEVSLEPLGGPADPDPDLSPELKALLTGKPEKPGK